MLAKKRCCFLSFDYSDFDVLLNASTFYRLAGYLIIPPLRLPECDLLVVFRGIPPRVYTEYTGLIHFYDYVCEHEINIREYFPNASCISVVSISRQHNRITKSFFIYGYLPVIPSIWQFSLPFLRRSSPPLHVSNYKPLVNDLFQQQLISLVKAGKVRVFGSKWDRIQVRARPLSYLSANIILSTSSICYGLMYPYQRGKSLSGRMWQAPIQGCVVLSEKGSNPFRCPGVFAVENFADLPLIHSYNPDELAQAASEFWLMKTKSLANDLDLFLDWKRLPFEVSRARFLMLKQHFEFSYDFYLSKNIFLLKSNLKELLRSVRDRLLLWRL